MEPQLLSLQKQRKLIRARFFPEHLEMMAAPAVFELKTLSRNVRFGSGAVKTSPISPMSALRQKRTFRVPDGASKRRNFTDAGPYESYAVSSFVQWLVGTKAN